MDWTDVTVEKSEDLALWGTSAWGQFPWGFAWRPPVTSVPPWSAASTSSTTWTPV